MKAKDTSHIGMIVGSISLCILFIVSMVKFFLKDLTLSPQDALALIMLAVSPSIPFCPIYISTWIDKLIEYKEKTK